MQDGPDLRYKQAVIAVIMLKFMYLGKCKIHFLFDMWELYHHNKLEAFTWNTSPIMRYWSSYPQALQRGKGLLPPPEDQGCGQGSQGSKSTTEQLQQPESCWERKCPGKSSKKVISLTLTEAWEGISLITSNRICHFSGNKSSSFASLQLPMQTFNREVFPVLAPCWPGDWGPAGWGEKKCSSCS